MLVHLIYRTLDVLISALNSIFRALRIFQRQLPGFVPGLVIITAFFLQSAGRIRMDAYSTYLITLLLLPFIVPYFGRYIKSLQLSHKGLSVEAVEDSAGKTVDEIKAGTEEDLFRPVSDLLGYVVAANTREPVRLPLEPGTSRNESSPPLLPHEQLRILATLWHYPKEHFSSTDNRRWGFKAVVPTGYLTFLTSAFHLRDKGLVVKDGGTGLFYLSDKGMEFCRINDAFLTAIGPQYHEFIPLE